MQPSLKPDFQPEDLLGHPRYGIAVLDEQHRLLLANSAFFQLTLADPSCSLGCSISEIWKGSEDIHEWLRDNSNFRRCFTLITPDGSLDVQQARFEANDSPFKTLIVSEATERLQLLKETEQIREAPDDSAEILRQKTEAAVLLKYFLRFAQDPPAREHCIAEAARIGETLFPSGGAFACEDGSEGKMVVTHDWGARLTATTFDRKECSGLSDAPSCSHLVDTAAQCAVLDDSRAQGLVWLHWIQEDKPIADIFCRAIKLALSHSKN